LKSFIDVKKESRGLIHSDTSSHYLIKIKIKYEEPALSGGRDRRIVSLRPA
jgi:hypothetical protein